MMFDINGLKIINDAFGHLAGDEAIKKLSKILEDEFLKKGILSRFGGDEFIIVKNNFVKKDKPGLIKAINDDIKDNLNSNMLSIPINFSVFFPN